MLEVKLWRICKHHLAAHITYPRWNRLHVFYIINFFYLNVKLKFRMICFNFHLINLQIKFNLVAASIILSSFPWDVTISSFQTQQSLISIHQKLFFSLSFMLTLCFVIECQVPQLLFFLITILHFPPTIIDFLVCSNYGVS